MYWNNQQRYNGARDPCDRGQPKCYGRVPRRGGHRGRGARRLVSPVTTPKCTRGEPGMTPGSLSLGFSKLACKPSALGYHSVDQLRQGSSWFDEWLRTATCRSFVPLRLITGEERSPRTVTTFTSRLADRTSPRQSRDDRTLGAADLPQAEKTSAAVQVAQVLFFFQRRRPTSPLAGRDPECSPLVWNRKGNRIRAGPR